MGKTRANSYSKSSLHNLSKAYQQDYDKVCKSYWARPENGTCGKALTSINKGKTCLSDADCPTSDTNTFAKCRCGFSTKGLKYCDIEGGDEAWLLAATNVSSKHNLFVSSKITKTIHLIVMLQKISALAMRKNCTQIGNVQSIRQVSMSTSLTSPNVLRTS